MKPKIVSYMFFFIVMGVLITSCQNRPKEVLNRNKMEQVMYDVYVAEAIMEHDYQHFNTPEKKEAFINEVFKKHHITQAQWDTSLSWYSDRIDLYLKMNDSVKARLQRERNDIEARLAARPIPQPIDPSLFQPSYIPSIFSFSMPSVRKGFRFQLDSAEINEKITDDPFSFTFSVIGMPPAQRLRLSSLLTLQYSDTTLYRWLNITENRTYSLPASKFIENDTLRHIYGFVHLQDKTGVASRICLYDIRMGAKPSTSVSDNRPQPETYGNESHQPMDRIRKAGSDTL